ncbi:MULTISPECIES: ABC transporter ATP-binding protein [Thermodesulfovibrio]|jgi:branched-chain amino acid transport system ATP-binding protein|uniref:Branched-chain amino acid ABC transporter, ATP-binding protein n=1 Tax=Thermodesulfovibrio yellowstonii (strain ATCC 51303 / DSM 11347 / YP87) TaxID=289376 RepID=B5YK42_THEYD|nr:MULTISPECIES: ABC transporter ATP-binding protein [Thermodesulfovibrio]ACI20653.1 branched-chain amino acid ABC transporter, ATP-binding protein [Thermodesulfovibrio yellowstonii DSM 11347]MDI6865352.1 ABC transporter ATP-binding protein [Thermodesulfovibrio yellowstonii]
MVILETKNLAKKYGGVEVLNNVNLKVYKGEILGMIGPNGAGKTTLMNLICKLTDITAGEIFYKGQLINDRKPYEIAKMGISRTFQVVKPFKGLTVLENVMVGAFYGKKQAKNKTEARQIAMEALQIVGLINEKDKEPSILPIAQRKKLELARALAMDPELLILDEVMAGLNPKELDDIMKEILLLKERGITIIAIEHVMKVIMGISDRVVVLHLGQLICEGKPNEVCNHPQVIEAYLGNKFAQRGIA